MARRKREYTELWWLNSHDYTTMTKVPGARLSRRKRLLFGCATARLVWDFAVRRCNRRAVLTSEANADRNATRAEMAAAWRNLASEAAMYSEWHIDALTAWGPYSAPTEADRQRFAGLDRAPFEVSRRQWSYALRDIGWVCGWGRRPLGVNSSEGQEVCSPLPLYSGGEGSGVRG